MFVHFPLYPQVEVPVNTYELIALKSKSPDIMRRVSINMSTLQMSDLELYLEKPSFDVCQILYEKLRS